MNRCAIIATHHKTGTVWMGTTFQAICRSLDIPLVNLIRSKLPKASDVKPPIVLFQPHSNFSGSQWLLENPEFRIFHLIRDPRDVIISAMHYHRHAKEKWLHLKRKTLGGATYQQKINSLSSDRERYQFEMENSSSNVIERMQNWNYARENAFECKYENLIVDEKTDLFAQILVHLGFSEAELEGCRRQFWRKSIFGKKAGRTGKTVHLRSGAARQWSSVFDRELAEAFLRRFGDVLVRLGYEKDDDWAAQLPSFSEKRKAS